MGANVARTCTVNYLRFGWRIATLLIEIHKTMPQEVSVSYQAIKSKVYRLIDTLVVGDKSEVEVQESIRRWWELIHPADRPIAQKYLLIVLARSCQALDAIEEGLTDATNHEEAKASDSSSAKAFKLAARVVKQAAKNTALSNSA